MWFPYKSRLHGIGTAAADTASLGVAFLRSLRPAPLSRLRSGHSLTPAEERTLFDAEMKRLEVDQSALTHRLAELRVMFWAYFWMSWMTFVTGAIWSIAFRGEELIVGVLMMLASSAPLAAAFRAGWRHWQGVTRRLSGFGDYWRNSALAPVDLGHPRAKRHRMLGRLARAASAAAVVFLVALSIDDALAQSTQEAMSAIRSSYASDRATIWLRSVFGASLFPTVGAYTESVTTVVGVYARFLNVGVAAFGSLLLSYNIAAGVAQTAHDGEILGKRWSSLWAPIRLVAGAGSMLPVVGGYCFAQVVMATAACWGIGLGNYVWGKVVDQTFQQGLPLAPVQPPRSLEHIRAMVEIQACKHYLNNRATVLRETVPAVTLSARRLVLDEAPASTVSTMPFTAIGVHQLPDAIKLNSVADIAGVKGRAIWTTEPAGEPGKRRNKWGAEICGKIEMPTMVGGNPLLEPILRAHIERIDQMLVDVDAYASWFAMVPFANGGRMRVELPPVESLAQIVESHDRALMEAASSVMREVRSSSHKAQSLRQAMARDGWTGAGSYYQVISRLNGEYLGAMTLQPKVTLPDWGELVGERYIGQDAGEVKMVMDRFFADIAPELKKGIRGGSSYSDYGKVKTTVSRADGPSGTMILESTRHSIEDPGSSGVTGAFIGTLNWLASSDGRQMWADPLGGLVAIGHSLLMPAEIALGAAVVMSGASLLGGYFGTVGKLVAGGASKLAGELGGLATFVIVLFGFSGAFLAYVLPLLPLISWILAVAYFIVLVAKAVIFATIWAVAHLRMEGDGIAGQAAEGGYETLLNVFLWPVLSIGGLLIGSAIFIVGANFAVAMLLPMMRDAVVASSGTGILQALAYIIVLIVVMVTLFEKSFALIHELPGQVALWIGGKGEQTSVVDQHAGGAKSMFIGAYHRGEASFNTGLNRMAQSRGAVPRVPGNRPGGGSGPTASKR